MKEMKDRTAFELHVARSFRKLHTQVVEYDEEGAAGRLDIAKLAAALPEGVKIGLPAPSVTDGCDVIGDGVEATPVGQVEVETGKLVIADAGNAPDLPDADDLEQALVGEAPGTSVPSPTGTFAAVVARVPDEMAIGKDAYPVFLLRDRGRSVGLFIDFGAGPDLPDPL